MMNAKGLIAMMVLLSALVLVACGGSSAESPSTASAPAQPVAAPSGWSSMAPLILANSETAVAEVNGLIYVVGGYPSSREISNAVQVYLPEDDRWRLAIPLPVPTHHAMAAAVNGKLYIIGGEASDSGFAGGGGPAGGQLGGDGAFGGGFGAIGGGGGRRGFGGGGFDGGTFGTVTTIEDGIVTITTQAGDVAIQITADTMFQIPSADGQAPTAGTQDDLELGEFVAIQGPEATDGTITAESITILPAGGFAGGFGGGGFGGGGFGGGGGGFGGGLGDGGGGAGAFADSTVGVVDSIDGDTVTITTQTGSVVVTLSEATVFESPAFGDGDDTLATRDSLEIGTRIAIQGSEDTGGSLLAETITVLPQATGGRFPGAGGRTQIDYMDTVWVYDPEESVWTLLTAMPTARSAGGTAVIDGKIYVVGGRPPQGQDFAVYDPASDSWTSLPPLPTARNHFATAAIDGKVYVVGGRFGGNVGSEMTAIVEVYDPATDAWTEAAAMPTARAGINGIASNGCLYIFGGEGNADDPAGVFDLAEVYDPASDTWRSLQAMPTPVHGVNGAAVINGGIYLPGGGTERGGSSGSTGLQVFGVAGTCGS